MTLFAAKGQTSAPSQGEGRPQRSTARVGAAPDRRSRGRRRSRRGGRRAGGRRSRTGSTSSSPPPESAGGPRHNRQGQRRGQRIGQRWPDACPEDRHPVIAGYRTFTVGCTPRNLIAQPRAGRAASLGQPGMAHQPLDGAPRDRDALPVQGEPDIAGAVDAVVLCVHPRDLGLQLLVARLPRGPTTRLRTVSAVPTPSFCPTAPMAAHCES
jgi:hypothetical protein